LDPFPESAHIPPTVLLDHFDFIKDFSQFTATVVPCAPVVGMLTDFLDPFPESFALIPRAVLLDHFSLGLSQFTTRVPCAPVIVMLKDFLDLFPGSFEEIPPTAILDHSDFSLDFSQITARVPSI
jgi:hypothetical protein